MDIKKDIESLIESISSIEKRHFLEVLGVIDGIKNVMRIHINLYKEYEILLIFAKKHNLFLCHTPYKLKVDWTNEIGDTFLKSVPWEDDTSEMFVAYISKNPDTNKIAQTIEIDSTNLEAGLLYQYPNCCCINYDLISKGELWLDLLLKNSSGIKFSPWANKLSYLVYEFCLFPDYFPCSFNCQGTIKLSESYYNLAVKYNLESFAKVQFEYMSGLYLVNENIIISTKIYHLLNESLNIDFSNYTSYKIAEIENHIDLSSNIYQIIYKFNNAFININNQEYRVLIFE